MFHTNIVAEFQNNGSMSKWLINEIRDNNGNLGCQTCSLFLENSSGHVIQFANIT